MSRSLLLLCLLLPASCGAPGTSATATSRSEPLSDFETALSWLPPETEALMVSEAPFPVFDLEQVPLLDMPRSFAILLFAALPTLTQGAPWSAPDLEVRFAILGLRDIYLPQGMEGNSATKAGVIRFAEPLPGFLDSLELSLPQARKVETRQERIGGEPVTVVHAWWPERWADPETDTFYRIDGDLLLWADQREDLLTMLERRASPPGDWVFPPGNLLRAQVPAGTKVWAVRRYDPEDAAGDPSSPLPAHEGQERKSASHIDADAIGLAYWFDDEDGYLTIRYLTANPEGAARMAEEWTVPREGSKAQLTPVKEGVFEIKIVANRESGMSEAAVMCLIGFAFFP